ncbi:hypothetical protein F2Q69_00054579 [Brassica cretica]|uniref:Uncharacterized protein n=1 Tax=Brassica cretica TaxID=69181 RepID=A0A8S9MXN6_BRACR|nr:hypothetical protein F2Q69_00054579 [Brassica cretica]
MKEIKLPKHQSDSNHSCSSVSPERGKQGGRRHNLRQQGNVSGVQRNVAVQIGDWSRVEMVATAPALLAISHLTFLTVQDGGDQRWGTKLGDQERVRAYQDPTCLFGYRDVTISDNKVTSPVFSETLRCRSVIGHALRWWLRLRLYLRSLT